MKKLLFSAFLVLTTAAFATVFGQSTPTPGAPAGVGTPAGAGDKNIGEDLIKLRSVEIERMKRETEKKGTTAASAPALNSKVETKFPEIKEDFEGIQIAQTAIIKTYTTDKKIDYALIENSAEAINKHAKRLDVNIFAEIVKEKVEPKDEKTPAVTEKPKTMRDLIVDLDNAIGNFVSSKMFANLRVVDPEVAIKARHDLTQIQELSERLSAEAKKLK